MVQEHCATVLLVGNQYTRYGVASHNLWYCQSTSLPIHQQFCCNKLVQLQYALLIHELKIKKSVAIVHFKKIRNTFLPKNCNACWCISFLRNNWVEVYDSILTPYLMVKLHA